MKITLTRSLIGVPKDQKATVHALEGFAAALNAAVGEHA